MVNRPSTIMIIIAMSALLFGMVAFLQMSSPTGRYLGLSSCVDMDNGESIFEQSYTWSLSGETKFDVCASPDTVLEAYCDGFFARRAPISCPIGMQCLNGACEP